MLYDSRKAKNRCLLIKLKIQADVPDKTGRYYSASHSHPEIGNEVWHPAHDTQKVIETQPSALRINLLGYAL